MLTAARWISAAGAAVSLLCVLLYLAAVHVDTSTAESHPAVAYFPAGLAASAVAGFAAWRGAQWGLLLVAGAAGLDAGLAYVSAPTLGLLVIAAAALYALAAAGFVAGGRRNGGVLASALLLFPAGIALGLLPLIFAR